MFRRTAPSSHLPPSLPAPSQCSSVQTHFASFSVFSISPLGAADGDRPPPGTNIPPYSSAVPRRSPIPFFFPPTPFFLFLCLFLSAFCLSAPCYPPIAPFGPAFPSFFSPSFPWRESTLGSTATKNGKNRKQKFAKKRNPFGPIRQPIALGLNLL